VRPNGGVIIPLSLMAGTWVMGRFRF